MIARPDTFVMPYCEVKLRSGNPEISLLPMSKVPFAPAFPSTYCGITLDDQQPMQAEARTGACTHCLLNGYLGGRVTDDFECHLSEFLITSTTSSSLRCRMSASGITSSWSILLGARCPACSGKAMSMFCRIYLPGLARQPSTLVVST